MKFYLDSSSIDEIRATLERGFVKGITTNPTLIRQATPTQPLEHISQIIETAKSFDFTIPISVQVMTQDPDEMYSQAITLVKLLDYENLVIKIPIGWDSLKAIKALTDEGIPVNCTACITAQQVVLAAGAGARYVSLFYGKMGDSGINAANMVREATRIADDHGAEIVIGSLRKLYDFQEIIETGTHIITVPYKWLPALAGHDKTTEAIEAFAANFTPFEQPAAR